MKNIVADKTLDHERANLAEMKKSPPGVSYGQICALCEPERFREITGIDQENDEYLTKKTRWSTQHNFSVDWC